MNNEELFKIAEHCTHELFRVEFSDYAGSLERYDILEYQGEGFFKKYPSGDNLWPRGLDKQFSPGALCIVYTVEGGHKASLIQWSFGGPDIHGDSDSCDVVITDSLVKSLLKKLHFDNVQSLKNWLEEEFLFGIGEGESMFFRVLGEKSEWLGRKCLAEVVGKRVGQKDYLVIEKVNRSPQNALNVQRGFAKIRFVGEREAEEANPFFKAQLDAGKADPNSIINLWRKYNDADEALLSRQRELSGVLRLEGIERRDGKNCAQIQSSTDTIENFKDFYEALKQDYPVVISSRHLRNSLSVKNVSFDCSKRTVSWEWDGVLPHDKIDEAEIRIDFKSWEVQSTRRKKALEAIRGRYIPIKTITDLLNKASVPTFRSDNRGNRIPDEWTLRKAFGEDSNPNPAQIKALKICLATPDIALIQGPPGTGKTSVIRALQNVLQQGDTRRRRDEIPSILLTSFQHVAVDNVAEGSAIWGLPIFRFYGFQRDREQIFKGLKEWQSKTGEAVDNQIAALNVGKECEKYEGLMRCLQYIKIAEYAHDIRSLLVEVLELNSTEHFLAPEESKELEEWARKFADPKKVDGDFYAHLMGIRISSTSFQDDGRENISKLLTYYNLRKKNIYCPTLDQAEELLKKIAGADSSPSEENFKWLFEVRSECLNQISSNKVGEKERERLRDYVGETLIPNIEKRIKHTDIRLAQILKEYREGVGAKSIRNAMMRYAMTFAATTQQSKSDAFVKMLGRENFGFDYVIVDEATRANPLDLFIPMTLARKKVILVGDHRQLPQLVDEKILEQMMEEERINEDGDAQKNSGGSAAQAHEKRKEMATRLEQSLFEALWHYLKNERCDGIDRTVTLDVQYRMPKKLGDFISSNFYEGQEIKTGKDSDDCRHNVSRYQKNNGECRCAVWEDVDGKETGRRSKKNEDEARRIVERLKEIIPNNTNETIGVIASYSAQVKYIEELVENVPVLKDAKACQKLEIGTIDAFQGKQFDVVFFSVVRNNSHHGFGFITMKNRLNVAFSRQKKLLVVVGSRKMFSSDEAKAKVPALSAFIDLADLEAKDDHR